MLDTRQYITVNPEKGGKKLMEQLKQNPEDSLC